MDSGTISLVLLGLITLCGTIYGIRKTRQSAAEQTGVASDANEISEFEANIRAFDLRAKNAEDRVGKLEGRLEKLEKKDEERERQLSRIRIVIQRWFAALDAAWPNDHPMPTISEADQELLGITLSKRITP